MGSDSWATPLSALGPMVCRWEAKQHTPGPSPQPNTKPLALLQADFIRSKLAQLLVAKRDLNWLQTWAGPSDLLGYRSKRSNHSRGEVPPETNPSFSLWGVPPLSQLHEKDPERTCFNNNPSEDYFDPRRSARAKTYYHEENPRPVISRRNEVSVTKQARRDRAE